jgi:hypothetical protein
MVSAESGHSDDIRRFEGPATRRMLPSSHANVQRQRASPEFDHDTQPPAFGNRPNSMPSEMSILSDTRTSETGSAVSTTPERDDDEANRTRMAALRQRLRRATSISFSESTQSEV